VNDMPLNFLPFVAKALPYAVAAVGAISGARARSRATKALGEGGFDPSRAFNLNPQVLRALESMGEQERSSVLDNIREIGQKQTAFLRASRFRSPDVASTTSNRLAAQRTQALRGLIQPQTMRFLGALDANIRAEQARSGDQFRRQALIGESDAGFFGSLSSIGTSWLLNRQMQEFLKSIYGAGGSGQVQGQPGSTPPYDPNAGTGQAFGNA